MKAIGWLKTAVQTKYKSRGGCDDANDGIKQRERSDPSFRLLDLINLQDTMFEIVNVYDRFCHRDMWINTVFIPFGVKAS